MTQTRMIIKTTVDTVEGAWEDTPNADLDDVAKGLMLDDVAKGLMNLLGTGEPVDNLAAHIARHDPARVLADVTAKRAIIAAYLTAGDNPTGEMRDFGHEEGLEEALEALANAWSDHPDFEDAWRIQVSPDSVGEQHH